MNDEHTGGIPFWKMSGAGNDFIVIDNRDGIMGDHDAAVFTRQVCRRRLSTGADGMILIETDPAVDFRWRFYNADGGTAEMCGNGARCAARFARENDIAGDRMVFMTDAGRIEAEVTDGGVRVKMTDPSAVSGPNTLSLDNGASLTYHFVNTGVPHAVVSVEDIDDVDVVGVGRTIRSHGDFAPAGTNANFIAALGENRFAIRTYERGVENETLACGTGAVAGALVAAVTCGVDAPVRMKTRSGSWLTIHFSSEGGRQGPVFMEGDARLIYTGRLTPESWDY